MRFEDVIGHDELKQKLKDNIKSGKVSHATMFVGNIGSGILPMAMAYGAEVLVHYSENPEIARQNCDKLIHADFHFSYPMGTTTSVKEKPKSLDFIAQFREAYLKNPYMSVLEWMDAIGIEKKTPIINTYEAQSISDQLRLKSYEGGYKVMVIWLPESMNATAANKLLKLLEEPPAQTLFVLACQEINRLLPTTISRVQTINLPPIPESELKNVLQSRHGMDQERASSLALVADGSYTYALDAIEHGEEMSFKSDFRDWMRALYGKKIYDIISFCEAMQRQSRPRQVLFITYGLHIFRECMVMNYASPDLQRLDENEVEFVQKFSPFINSANVLEMVSEFEKGAADISRNANAKILFLDLSLKAMKLIRVKPQA